MPLVNCQLYYKYFWKINNFEVQIGLLLQQLLALVATLSVKLFSFKYYFHLPINDWNKSHYEGWKLEFDNSRIMLRICIINYIKKSVFFSISLSCQILHCIAWGVRFSAKWTNPRNNLYNKLLRSIILSSNISIWTKVSGLFIWVVCTGCLKNKINFSKRGCILSLFSAIGGSRTIFENYIMKRANFLRVIQYNFPQIIKFFLS